MALGTVQSSIWINGQQCPSIVPGTPRVIKGYVTIPANTSFATTDKIQLCQICGPNSHIVGFNFDFPALDAGNGVTFALKDTLTSPTTIFTGNTVGQAGGWVGTSSAAHGTILDGETYTQPTELDLVPSHASTSTTGTLALTIYFEVTEVNDL